MKKFIIGIFASLYVLAASSVSYAADLAETPLFLQNSAYPNLLFNLSIETPMGSQAYNDQRGVPNNSCPGRFKVDGKNFGGCYFSDVEYIGYFDSRKCYAYSGSTFIPKSKTADDFSCSGLWSGNFLNWGTTLAIDTLIYSMTGGNRITDTAGTTARTVVRRAKRSGFDNGWWKVIGSFSGLNGSVKPSSVTPYTSSAIYIKNVSNSHTFEVGNLSVASDGSVNFGSAAKFNTQLEVCNSTVSLEENCAPYSNGVNTYYKPEGLIQENSNRMRFAVSSYTADNSRSRHGGVIRSNMKYVGDEIPGSYINNANKEVNADGTFVSDPDGLTAESGVYYSGVINYLNKFSDYGYKGIDPASELYYEALRYYKGSSLKSNALRPTPEYISGLSDAQKGGFPVFSKWDDPILYSCQQNFIVAISDAYSWRDKKLPGSYFTKANGASCNNDDCGEPSNPDPDINVTELTNRVGALEGIGNIGQKLSPGNNCATGVEAGCTSATINSGNGRENSYYISGLSYYANTQDIRSDFDGDQTVKTYMIDSQEYNSTPLGNNKYNQLWLAGKYGGFDDLNENGVPDDDVDGVSEWDEDGDGQPDGFILATQPTKMLEGLRSAFEDIIKLSASASAASVNTTSVRSDTKVYQSVFSNFNWSGNLLAYELNSDGSIGDLQWDVQSNLPLEASRNIFSLDANGDAISFEWDSLSDSQKKDLENDEDLFDFIRGDRSNEFGNGSSKFRERDTILGDIVHSSPVSVGVPRAPFTRFTGDEGTSYQTFITANKDRDEIVYVGSNDGMMHGFNANTGAEVMAYVPKAVYPNLPNLADFDYSHKYYVDGQISTGEAYLNEDWRTVLIGTLGAGGKAVYALDVTSPSNFSSDASKVVKWEFDGGTESDDLGYIPGNAVITRLVTGEWAAIFGNGYNSNNQQASLFIVNLEDGSLIRKISTGVGSSATPNGLSEPALIDTDGDLSVDYVYAGDLLGNLWKFDLTNSMSSKWEIAVSQGQDLLPIFTTSNSDGAPQAITTRPSVINGPENRGGYLISFGTGSYMFNGDNIVPALSPNHSVYAVWDDEISSKADVIEISDLVEQFVIEEQRIFNAGEADEYSVPTRSIKGSQVDYDSKKGWFMDLPENGERVVARTQSQFGKLFFTTYTPTENACDNGGTSWLMGVDAYQGDDSVVAIFDINQDGTYETGVSGIEILGTTAEAARLCLDSSCEEIISIVSGQSGELTTTSLAGDNTTVGRQSWRQIK